MFNPYDFNRDGRWSMPGRTVTHYYIGEEDRRADAEGGGGPRYESGCGSCLNGCGCLLVILVFACILIWGLAGCVFG